MALSVIVAIVGGIALMSELSISAVERTKEIGVLRAIDARLRTIIGVFLMEGILQGLLSCLVGGWSAACQRDGASNVRGATLD